MRGKKTTAQNVDVHGMSVRGRSEGEGSKSMVEASEEAKQRTFPISDCTEPSSRGF